MAHWQKVQSEHYKLQTWKVITKGNMQSEKLQNPKS